MATKHRCERATCGWAIASGRTLIDANLETAFAKPTAELTKLAASWHVPPSVFWRQLLGLAADLPVNSELADRVHRRLVGGAASPTSLSRLTGLIAECETLFRQTFPRASEELPLRVGPLESAWEARGPGIMAMIQSSTAEDFLVEAAGVVLVQPVVGGDGLAHLTCNRVHIEAVLTNVEPRLPETLRLAWLLGQLNLDRPVYSDRVHGHALGEVAELALLPVVLAAAEEVELTPLSGATLELALQCWLRKPSDKCGFLAELLLAWWETSTEGQWDWNTRLTGLAQMLQTQN